MRISVIIPVFNAENFVLKAVESALEQEETGEVIMVEDYSSDDSLKVCKAIEKEYQKVRLLRHPDGKNHGAGASRNLGIKNARFKHIAFLDADDFYLEGRFKVAKQILEKYPNIDGVCEAIGFIFHDDQAKRRWLLHGGNNLTTMKEGVSSGRLFETLVEGGKGWFHLDGLVVNKNIFENCGYFFKELKLHQDTAMFIQMAEYGKLVPGRLQAPVAMKRIHPGNRFSGNHNWYLTKFLLWKTMFYWANKRKLKKTRLVKLFHNYLLSMYHLSKENRKPLFENRSQLSPLLFEAFRRPFLSIGAAVHLVFTRFSSS